MMMMALKSQMLGCRNTAAHGIAACSWPAFSETPIHWASA